MGQCAPSPVVVSLIHAWNSEYADASPTKARLQTWDFQRLYTNIQLTEMKDKVKQLVSLIFHSEDTVTTWH